MPEQNETQPGKSDKSEPRPPRNDLEAHAPGEAMAGGRPRSTRDISNEAFRCGYWGHRRSDGELCRGMVVQGTRACVRHTGLTVREAKAKGAVVLELKKWGLEGHEHLADPGETLLRLLTQSVWRVEKYAALLGRAYEAAESGESFDDDVRRARVSALIGYKYGVDREGNRYPIEEAIRGLVLLEANERAFARDTAAKATAAGLAERQVRILEQQGELIVGLLRRVAAAMGFSPEDQVRYSAIVAQELRQLAG